MKSHPDDAIIQMRLNALRERPIFNGFGDGKNAVYVKQAWLVQRVREDPDTGLPITATVAVCETEQEAELKARELLMLREAE